ncbi:hypothetical protein ACT3HK_15320 [Thermolongibacillus altinsuensis]
MGTASAKPYKLRYSFCFFKLIHLLQLNDNMTPAHLTLDGENVTDFEKVYEALTYLKMKYIVEKKYEVKR